MRGLTGMLLICGVPEIKAVRVRPRTYRFTPICFYAIEALR